jgi:hypothetical protein
MSATHLQHVLESLLDRLLALVRAPVLPMGRVLHYVVHDQVEEVGIQERSSIIS